ncbi:MAG TPA: hypothetical protein VN721_03225 [Flavipsychrobacter sp.]|nr:hypothetical protein [Flavipsychrobacter sp.]
MIYILAMQEADVPASKKNIYQLLFPSIKSLALQIVGEGQPYLVETDEKEEELV